MAYSVDTAPNGVYFMRSASPRPLVVSTPPFSPSTANRAVYLMWHFGLRVTPVDVIHHHCAMEPGLSSKPRSCLAMARRYVSPNPLYAAALAVVISGFPSRVLSTMEA